MKGYKQTLFIFATIIVLSNALAIDADEDLATVENEDNDINVESVITRDERILWPYSSNKNKSSTDEQNTQNSTKYDDDEVMKKEERRKRFIWTSSYPQSPIVDLMMQTMAVNYSPNNPSDPFDFLRDSYPLPKGECEYELLTTISTLPAI